ncbi:MAG: DUF4421 family protein [Dysgonomonas sp.]
MKLRLTLFILLLPLVLQAQIDTTYIKEYTQLYSIRLNFFDDFNSMTRDVDDVRIVLKSNNPNKLGFGVSWKNKSFRYSQGINWGMNDKKGKTTTYDFKYHSYKSTYFYDIVVQQLEGFYDKQKHADGTYTTYPDLNLKQIKLHGQYVFNNKKFSFKSSFGQSEKQVKSAGSFLLGGGIYYNRLKSKIIEVDDQTGFRIENLQMGVSGGYAYTWVINSHLYLTGAGNLGLNVGSDSPWAQPFKHKISFYPSLYFRTAAGYDINSWSFATSFIINQTSLYNMPNKNFELDEGTLHFTVIKRINWENEWLNKTLSKVFDEWLGIF